MSAFGTKRTLPSAPHMSAFDPKRTSLPHSELCLHEASLTNFHQNCFSGCAFAALAVAAVRLAQRLDPDAVRYLQWH